MVPNVTKKDYLEKGPSLTKKDLILWCKLVLFGVVSDLQKTPNSPKKNQKITGFMVPNVTKKDHLEKRIEKGGIMVLFGTN